MMIQLGDGKNVIFQCLSADCKVVHDCLSLMKDQRDLSRALELLSTWIVATTTSLESENKTVWPQIGIDFAQGMLDVLESQQNVNKDELGLNSVRIPLLIQAHKNQKVHIMQFFIDLGIVLMPPLIGTHDYST